MIPDPTPYPDPTLDQWLTTGHTALINALDEVLDLDTGLADATLTTHYNTLTTGLDHVLDLNAGLRDIQPSPPQSTSTTTDRATSAGSLTDYAHHIATRPAHERLATRTWFPQHELTVLQAISAAEDGVRALRPVLDLVLDRDRDLEHDHARDHARVLIHDLDRALRPVFGRGLRRARALALDSDRARVLDSVLARDLARDLARALVGVRALALALTLDSALDLDLDLDSVRVLGRVLGRAHDDIVDRTCYRLRAINNDLAHSLADTLKRADTLTSQDLRTALTQLKQALTDVTGADLTHANLNGVPLDGVLWSSDTRWPHHLREPISQNSLPIGPDLYRINPRGIGKDTFIDQTL
jgi:hypothetical protein